MTEAVYARQFFFESSTELLQYQEILFYFAIVILIKFISPTTTSNSLVKESILVSSFVLSFKLKRVCKAVTS